MRAVLLLRPGVLVDVDRALGEVVGFEEGGEVGGGGVGGLAADVVPGVDVRDEVVFGDGGEEGGPVGVVEGGRVGEGGAADLELREFLSGFC